MSPKKKQLLPTKAATTKAKRKAKAKAGRPSKHPAKFCFDGTDPFSAGENGVDFIIRGKPLPQQRDRIGKNGARYNPSKRDQQQAFNAVCKALFQEKGRRIPFISKGVEVSVSILYGFPSTKKQNIHTKADIDNLLKFTLDALGEGRTFYHDDGQVTGASVKKCFDEQYGGDGFTHVTISGQEVIEIED